MVCEFTNRNSNGLIRLQNILGPNSKGLLKASENLASDRGGSALFQRELDPWFLVLGPWMVFCYYVHVHVIKFMYM